MRLDKRHPSISNPGLVEGNVAKPAVWLEYVAARLRTCYQIRGSLIA
jgi:hypothetical protein